MYTRLSAQRLPRLNLLTSRVFSVTDSCLHFAECGSYLLTCCVQRNCTIKLARTFCKTEQIILNRGPFFGMYRIHFPLLTFGFGIVFGIHLAFSYEGSY